MSLITRRFEDGYKYYLVNSIGKFINVHRNAIYDKCKEFSITDGNHSWIREDHLPEVKISKAIPLDKLINWIDEENNKKVRKEQEKLMREIIERLETKEIKL